MQTSGIGSLSRNLQTTERWIEELAREPAFSSEAQAYRGLKAVLQTLRDRLPIAEGAHLSSQLPTLIRGFYYEAWHPTNAPMRLRSADGFVALVRERLRSDAVDPGEACRAVFRLLERKLAGSEIEDVKHQMPEAIRALWPR